MKSIRISQSLQQKFRKVRVLLECKQCEEVSNLDMETRWASSFTMIRKYYELREAFISMITNLNSKPAFDREEISDDDWKKFKMVTEFLELAVALFEMSSSIENDTMSVHPAMSKNLTFHCEE